MPCKHYKDALIDAAASGATPQGELRAHLAECASSRAAFAEEQSLFATIDSSLHAAANTEVPPSLLPRVRARLEESAVPRFRWLQPLVFVSASAALAVAVFLLVRPHRVLPEDVAKQSAVAVPAPTVPSTETNPEKISSKDTQVPAVHVTHFRAARNSTNRGSAASSNPEVLVPPDEREGLSQFVDGLRQGRVLVADAKLQPEDLTIAPSEIAPIEVKALETLNPSLVEPSGE